MKNKYIFIALLIFCQINLFAQDFQWVEPFQGSNSSGNEAVKIEVDDNENNYTFGKILSTLFDIDPTSNGSQIIDNSQSGGQHCSLFLTKLDINGNFVWGKTFGSLFANSDNVVDIEIGSDGNIYLLADIYEQTTFMQKFITIFKVDPQGNILMTKKITNLNPSQYDIYSSSSLALDSQNNIFITGSYNYHFKIDLINPQLDFNFGRDSFLLKIDNNGSIVFGKTFGVLFTNAHYESVKIGSDQNPIVVVSNGDNQSYTNYGYNIFKINSNDASIQWQKYLDNQDPAIFNIDHSGNIIIAGNGKNPSGNDIDVDPNSTISNINPTRYILWLTSNGDFLDVKQYPAVSAFGYFKFSKIEFDVNNNTYIVGEFNENIDVDPSTNSYLLSYFCPYTTLIRDAFYIKFDNNRNFDSAFKLGDYNSNCLNFYFTDFRIKNGNQYYVGNFDSTSDFDPTSNVFLVSLNNVYGSIFTLKLGPCNSSMPIGNATQTFCSSQNPTVGNLLPNSTAIKWYDSAISTNQLSSTTPIVNGQTYYAAKQTGACPESQRLAVTATINQSPASPIAANQTFCESENATIASLVVTGQDVKWYSSITDTNSLPITTLLQNNTNYYATQTVNGCESARTLITVTVNSVTSPTISSPQTFCVQQNALLSSIAITGQNIKWYDSVTGGSLLLNSTSLVDGQTYYASQTVNNCESLRVPVLIHIQNTSLPTGSATQTFCSTQNPTLNDVVVNGANLNWYTSLSSVNAISSATLLVNGSTYYVTQTINYCESVSRLAVTVTLINTLSANDYSENVCDDLNDGSEIIDLTNYNANLISNVANCTFDYYTSLIGATNQINSDLISSITNYHLTTGNPYVFVRITSINGCHQIVKLNLTLVNTPVISIADIVPICEKNSVTINAGSGFDSYTWSTGATSQTITTLQAGNYSVTVTKNYGTTTCSSTKNFTVVLSNSATITSIDTQDWTDTDNVITVNLSASSIGNYEYSIDGINYQASANFYGLDSGYYTVYIRDKNGCGVATEEVFLLMYPKFFTPNSDGYNDTWSIRFSRYEPKFKVVIYDRYGKPLKSLKNSSSWDGKYDGNELPSDDYWFVVTRENGKEYKGHFTLKR